MFQMPLLDVEMLPSSNSSVPSTSQWRPSYNPTNSHNSNHTANNARKEPSGNKVSNEDAGGDEVEELNNDSDDMFEDDAPEIMMEDEDTDIMMLGTRGTKGSSSDMVGGSRRPPPLLPDDYGDETMAAIKFSEEFIGRYGRPHPGFFPGSLDDAIRESCMQPAKDVSKL